MSYLCFSALKFTDVLACDDGGTFSAVLPSGGFGKTLFSNRRGRMVSLEVMVSEPVMVEKPVLLETQYGASEEAPCIYENTRDLSVPQGIIGSQFS